MSRTDSLFQSLGAMRLPVEESDVTDSLNVLDPAQSILTELFKAAINAELRAVWQKVASQAHVLAGTDPVADTLEMRPSKGVMQQRKPVFPLLCVHRDGKGTFDEVTLQDERLTQHWSVHYILGTLDVADERKLAAMCMRVAAVIQLVVRQRGHRAYRDGELQFFPDRGAFSSIRLVEMEEGQALFAADETGPVYHALTVTLETTEKTRDDLSAFGDAEGVDLSAGVGNGDTIAPDLLQSDSSATPRE